MGRSRRGWGTFVGPAERSGMSRGNLEEVRDGSRDPRWTGTGLGTIPEVRDRLGYPWRGPGRAGGPSGRYGTSRGTLGEVQDGSGYPWEGPGWFGVHSERSGTGRGTLAEVLDGSGDPWGGPERVRGPSRIIGRVGEPSGRSRRGWGSFVGPAEWSGMSRENLGEVRDGSRDPRGSGTGQGTIPDVRDGSGVTRVGPA